MVLIIKAFAWRQSKNMDVMGFQKVYYELSENGISYELTVSETAYEKIQRRLQFFKEHKEKLEYSRLGL